MAILYPESPPECPPMEAAAPARQHDVRTASTMMTIIPALELSSMRATIGIPRPPVSWVRRAKCWLGFLGYFFVTYHGNIFDDTKFQINNRNLYFFFICLPSKVMMIIIKWATIKYFFDGTKFFTIKIMYWW